jgi:hypothetical protein
MAVRSFGIICFFFGAIGLIASGTKEAAPVIVDLHAHRAEIRSELLKHTRIGSSVKEVIDFISKQLQRTGATSPLTVEPIKDDSRSHVAKAIRFISVNITIIQR